MAFFGKRRKMQTPASIFAEAAGVPVAISAPVVAATVAGGACTLQQCTAYLQARINLRDVPGRATAGQALFLDLVWFVRLGRV